MRVQFLGPPSPIQDFLGDHEQLVDSRPHLGVSHGYRQLVGAKVLRHHPVVNLHPSFLPWNRGAYPNYWAAHDGTPPGVSIHWMDEGIDTGPVITQIPVPFEPDDTLRTSYDRLQRRLVALFITWWPMIRDGITGLPQGPNGNTHRVADLPELPEGWDTPVAEVAP